MSTAVLRGITKSYPMGQTMLHALRGVDLEVAEGELCALMGPSGSGKTTLLNILGCLDVPTSGSYQLGGRPIVARDFDQLADVRSREIGFVFQTFNLIPVLSAWENIELSLICSGRGSSSWRRERVDQLVDAVGLGDHRHHRPDQLSGGQQQRVAIARAIASAPRLILADEPTANLDTATATAILDLLFELNRAENVTVIFSTHDPRVLRYASRKVYLRDGRIVDRDDDPAPEMPAAGVD